MVARQARIAGALLMAIVAVVSAAPSVSADGGLELTTPFPAVAVAPGSKVTFDLTLSSTRSAIVDLSVSGVPQGWTASLLGGGNVVAAASVTPDKPTELRLDVDVPQDAVAGDQAFRVRATGGGASDTLDLTVRVDAAAAGDISLTTTTPTLTGATDANFSFSLVFHNDTPQDVTLAVSAGGPDGWTVTPTLTGESQAAATVVNAGATQNVSIAVDPPRDAPAGAYPITVEASAGDRTTTADLGIEITGSYSADLTTPDDLLSASGSAGAPTTLTFDVTNTGTAPLTDVKVVGTPPSGWDVTVDPASIDAVAPNTTGTFSATITPSSEAVAGDYVVSFRSSATESGADSSASIRFTVETSPLWAIVGLGIIVLILGGLFLVFRTYGRR
jgi:uncharacterized membrane protein